MSTLGAGKPKDEDGAKNDYYLDVATGDVYQKAESTWEKKGTLPPWEKTGEELFFAGARLGVGVPPRADDEAALRVGNGPLVTGNSKYEVHQPIGSFRQPAGALKGLQIVGKHAYLACGAEGLVIVELTLPDKIALVGTYKPSGVEVKGVRIAGDVAYLACGAAGLHLVDIRDPARPKKTSEYKPDAVDATSVRCGRGHVYFASGDVLHVLTADITGAVKPGSTYSASSTIVDFAIDAKIEEGDEGVVETITGYVNVGNDLEIVNLSAAAAPTKLSSYAPARVEDGQATFAWVEVSEERLYLACADTGEHESGGLLVFASSDPKNVKGGSESPLYATDHRLRGVVAEGNLIYLLSEDGAIDVVSLDSAAKTLSPRQRLRLEGLTGCVGIALAGKGAKESLVLGVGSSAGLSIVAVTEEGFDARFEGKVEFQGGVYLKGFPEGRLVVDEEGKIQCEPPLKTAELYERKVAPFLRVAGEASILLAANTGQSVLKWDKYGLPSATVRTFVNAAVGFPGVFNASIDWVETWHHIWENVDSIITNTAIAKSDYEIRNLKKRLGWRGIESLNPLVVVDGWARHVGRFVDATAHDDDVVIGSGHSALHPLTAQAGNVVFGAGSTKASIVIRNGDQDEAGSVAIGHESRTAVNTRRSVALGPFTEATASDAVAIGSGLAANPLTATHPKMVTLGAGSNQASIVIRPGGLNEAGTVTIGHAAVGANTHRSLAIGPYTSVTADDAVVIGSGLVGHVLPGAGNHSVVLGAGSDQASIAITAGAQGQAGSVAVGHASATGGQRSLAIGSHTLAAGNDGVVIGSGLVGHVLPGAGNNSVVLGAGSDQASIAIIAGAAGQAGSVAVGHASASVGQRSLALGSHTSAAGNDAVVIGSGLLGNVLPGAGNNSVVLGAGSDQASIAITAGGAGQAGSVAVGHASASGGQRSLALGSHTSAAGNDAVVIGSGLLGHVLPGAGNNSVVLGAGSDQASIAITAGAAGQAGSVAVGHASASGGQRSVAVGSYTSAAGNDAVVIGSGLLGHVLPGAGNNSVVLGAGSDQASIVIVPGAQNRAGSVAVGHQSTVSPAAQRSVAVGQFTEVTAPAHNSVVIGSGTPNAPLQANAPNTVVLGARTTAMVIDSNSIVVHKSILPNQHDTLNLGSDDVRFADLYMVGHHSLHIGEKGNEALIRYDGDKKRLKLEARSIGIGTGDAVIGMSGDGKRLDLGDVQATEVAAKSISITGLSPDAGANYLALGSDNKIKCVPGTDSESAGEAKKQADRARDYAADAKAQADRVEALGKPGGDVKSDWESFLDGAKEAFGAAKTALGALETAANLTAADLAMKAATASVAAAKAASESAAVSFGSAGVASGAATSAGVFLGLAKEQKEGAEDAAKKAEHWNGEAKKSADAVEGLIKAAKTTFTDATRDAKRAYEDAKGEAKTAADSYGSAKGEAETAKGAYGTAKGEAEAAKGAYGKAKGDAEAAAKSFGDAKGEAKTAADSYGKAKGDAEAAAKSFGDAKGEAKTAADSYGKAKGEAKTAADSYGKAKGEAEAAAEAYAKAKQAADAPAVLSVFHEQIIPNRTTLYDVIARLTDRKGGFVDIPENGTLPGRNGVVRIGSAAFNFSDIVGMSSVVILPISVRGFHTKTIILPVDVLQLGSEQFLHWGVIRVSYYGNLTNLEPHGTSYIWRTRIDYRRA